jgi:D-glycero-D-manno-heptose 1,7-bisphosphate phosphatase
MNKAIFIDKDGTLIEDIPYNVDPSRVKLQAETIEGLKRLKRDGFLLIVVSNQSGIARGYFAPEAIVNVRLKIEEILGQSDIKLDDLYFCPHHPEGSVTEYSIECNCRKPQPGMILKAAEKFNVDLSRSWMIGDILHDIEAGNQAGCRTILIDNGNETEWEIDHQRRPTGVARTINEAAIFILNHKGHD